MKRICAVMMVLAGVSCAQGQFEQSVWPGFKGTRAKQAAVKAQGPATELAFSVEDFATVSPGGFTVAANGDVYFQTYFTTAPGSKVYRLDGQSGAVLAESIDLGGAAGNYAGVAIGEDALYTCVYTGAGNTRIVKLHKSTLAVLDEFTSPAFGGLRGTPLIGDVKNNNGNVNLYVPDRNAVKVHAVDSVTGQVMWSYSAIYDAIFGQAGPMWTLANGRQAIAYFGNGDLGPGAALEDLGGTTFNVLWEAVGPGNFNWWGSGAMSDDQSRIYVTTFNDGGTDAMWAIDASNGGVIWSLGMGVPGGDHNHFARPAVVGNRIYAAGNEGRVVAYHDNGATGQIAWTHQNSDPGEFTTVSAAAAPSGEVFVYAVQQEDAQGAARYVALRDDGASFTLMEETTLNGTMRRTLFGNNSATVDASGRVWVAGGRFDDPAPGDIHVFEPDAGCYPDCDGSGVLNIDDFICFQLRFALQDPYADCDGNSLFNIDDFICFQLAFALGC